MSHDKEFLEGKKRMRKNVRNARFMDHETWTFDTLWHNHVHAFNTI